MKTILFFYAGFHDKVGLPSYNPFEYRFLEVLCKKYRVVVVVFTRGGQRKLTEKIAPANVEFAFIDDFPLYTRLPPIVAWPLRTITHILQVALLIRSVRPDLVDSNWVTRSAGFYCAVVNHHPLLTTAWGSDILIEAKKSFILRAFARFTLRVTDGVIVDSEIQQKAVLERGCSPSKIHSFPWGIDLDKFKPRKDDTIRSELGWSGDERIIISTRMHSPTYGIEYLIRAMPLILDEVNNARFLVIGAGPLIQYHKDLAKELGVSNQVKFLGLVSNDVMPKILNSADLYVSTSFSDGTSASLLEAMACGLPIVATKIPANEEWIVQGQNGFLVPAGDSLELAKCVMSILRDDQLRSRMSSQNLRTAAERADWKKNSLVFEKCVSDLLNSGQRHCAEGEQFTTRDRKPMDLHSINR